MLCMHCLTGRVGGGWVGEGNSALHALPYWEGGRGVGWRGK